MSIASPLQTIAVGVIVERTKGTSQWTDFLWRPVSVLVGVAATAPWTKLSDDGEHTTFFAGVADIELYRTETPYYQENLASGAPLLWVALRPTETDPPYALLTVTADPAEGEGLTEAGNDLVETVPMPMAIQEAVAAFVVEHYVERTFAKRKRDRIDPEALARRVPARDGDKQ